MTFLNNIMIVLQNVSYFILVIFSNRLFQEKNILAFFIYSKWNLAFKDRVI